jgi:signal recognition particle subunit SRP54
MFEIVTDKFEQLLRQLRGHGKISARNIEDALRDIRIALLEADVNFHVVKSFIEHVKTQALGQDVLASLTPEQHFIKIVHGEIVALLGGTQTPFTLSAAPPVVVMLVGLNGSGKTTTTGKLARYIKSELHRTPYLVPADVYRPAAIEQLGRLAATLECPVHPTVLGADPVDIATEALAHARRHAYDVVLVDTAGRLHVDEPLMQELERMTAAVRPHHVLLVADAMTGQDAVNLASGFKSRLPLTGVVLTKSDGDARGGAALSLRAVTGTPILFLGVGEKLDALEPFHPDRVASRVLGMGDVLSLIEKAERAYDRDHAEALERKLRRNDFDLSDFRSQLRAVRRMGSIGDLLGMVPGMKRFTRDIDTNAAEREIKKAEAIIDSMTVAERRNVLILNGGRRRRVALGSGTSVSDVNRLVKQFTQTKKLLKRMKGGAMPQLPRQLH